jgi:hypothetical protein
MENIPTKKIPGLYSAPLLFLTEQGSEQDQLRLGLVKNHQPKLHFIGLC